MIRIFLLCAVLCEALFLSLAARAGEPARLALEESSIVQASNGVELRLALSQGVPFRVFTLDAPERLVIDFRGLEGQGDVSALPQGAQNALSDLRYGVVQPGWARLVADLSEPMLPGDIEMSVDPLTGNAELALTLSAASSAQFANASGVPKSSAWPQPEPAPVGRSDASFVVVLDPGHGGIDPGAERDGVSEKELVLMVAQELRRVLEQEPDVAVVLTRDSDEFVSLQARVSIAHQVEGDLFVSIHADALSEGGAQGATVYTLSQEASDAASAHLAARHNRADVIAGLDLTGSDDEVTRVLLDLARQETEPRSDALAQSIVKHMARAGGPMNRRPLRQAGFSVLKSADIPSVLVEVGFLSSPRDLQNLKDPEWRAGMADAMAEALLAWRKTDKTYRTQVRR